MARPILERELQRLQDEILRMGSEVEENLVKAVDALRRRDAIHSRQLIAADRWVNEKRITIGMECMSLIATQQPAAGDMRLLAAIIEIVGELERIHDYVKGIARISLMLDDQRAPKTIINALPHMAEKVRQMLRGAMDAFAYRDVGLARTVPQSDSEVDGLYNQHYKEIISYIMKDPTTFEHATYVEWAAHNLERTADRAINICEWVVYMLTGEYKQMDVDELEDVLAGAN